MSKKKYEQQLAALESLRGGSGNPEAEDGLRKALANPNNYLVAKAAQIASQDGQGTLIPDLESALERFFVNPTKSDPQCWAKNAIVKALADLGHDDPAVYLRGLRYVQMEPVWGGQEDTAATLRAQCALALVQCRSLSDLVLLSHLLELLFDRNKVVRIEAARAIGRISRTEAALLLRVRALAGDEEPEVLGACFAALLSIEGCEAIDFLEQFLNRGGETAAEAALALGLLPEPRALAVLKERWTHGKDPDLSAVLLTAMALMRLPQAFAFLIHRCETEPAETAKAVLKALSAARVSAESHLLIAQAIKRNRDPDARAAFEKYFQQ